MVLHISAYSIRCLLSPFPAIYRRFVIRALVGDDILDLCGLLIALATLDSLCWIYLPDKATFAKLPTFKRHMGNIRELHHVSNAEVLVMITIINV